MASITARSISDFRLPVSLILVYLICAGIYLTQFAYRAQVVLDIEIGINERSDFKIYWAGPDQGFSERNSSSLKIHGPQQKYTMRIGNLGSINRLRIDPVEHIGPVTIRLILFRQSGFESIRLETRKDFEKLQPLNQMNPLEFNEDALILRTTGTDGQLLLDLAPAGTSTFPTVHVFNLLGLLLLLCLMYGLARHSANLSFVPFALAGVLALITVMAGITNFNVHPDEKVHFRALNYYSDHYLPPNIDDPDIAHTFSEFGKSRLSAYEAYYPVAGYFTKLLSPLNLSDLMDARLVGVFMFAVLLVISILNPAFRYFTLPLLITPQAWYLYSYVNSDAFGLFLVIFVAYLAAYENSMLNRFLVDDTPTWFWTKAVLMGALFGACILLKPNYYFFVLFLGFYLLWRIYYGDFKDRKRLFIRLALLALIGLSLPAMRFGLDLKANGPDTFKRYREKIEETAAYWYRPSTPMENKHIALYNRERGISLDHVFHHLYWGENIFSSSFGSYGYAQFVPSEGFYNTMRLLSIGLFLVMLVSVLVHGPPAAHSLFLLTSVSALILLGASLMSNWNIVYQPQGRYLAPILAMMGMLIYHVRKYLSPDYFFSVVAAMYLMSLYSFIFLGLRFLEKT